MQWPTEIVSYLLKKGQSLSKMTFWLNDYLIHSVYYVKELQ